jgi:hypothetical protein
VGVSCVVVVMSASGDVVVCAGVALVTCTTISKPCRTRTVGPGTDPL